MRRLAWLLLLAFSFTVPWEYSLNLGGSLGSVARFTGLLLLAVALPAMLLTGRMRSPGALQWLALAYYLWFFCSCLWTIDLTETLEKMRGYIQQMLPVWFVWEFAEEPEDLRALLRTIVAGCWVLALLTLANFRSIDAMAAGQIRFAAYGQDPNDVARFLDLGLPLAALLIHCEPRWPARLLAFGYFPVGLLAVLLTASRGGFLAGLLALGGCVWLLVRGRKKVGLATLIVLPAAAIILLIAVPMATIERLATIPEQLNGGDLNQRLNIWVQGWKAFTHAPWLGTGAGTFVAAAGVAPVDTAHNTALTLLVTGGLFALLIALALVVVSFYAVLAARGALRLALFTALLVWVAASMVSTVEESRFTWILLALAAVAGRFARQQPAELAACFRAYPMRFWSPRFLPAEQSSEV
jgi:O-antigen ligase